MVMVNVVPSISDKILDENVAHQLNDAVGNGFASGARDPRFESRSSHDCSDKKTGSLVATLPNSWRY